MTAEPWIRMEACKDVSALKAAFEEPPVTVANEGETRRRRGPIEKTSSITFHQVVKVV